MPVNYLAARHFGAIRSALLTYGIAVTSLLLSRSTPEPETSPLLFLGTGLQVALMVIDYWIRQHPKENPPSDALLFASVILELTIDAITVLLFAVGTFRSIAQATADL